MVPYVLVTGATGSNLAAVLGAIARDRDWHGGVRPHRSRRIRECASDARGDGCVRPARRPSRRSPPGAIAVVASRGG